jgi:transposase
MARLRPYFPKSHGKPRVDDRRVLSGIVFVNRKPNRWFFLESSAPVVARSRGRHWTVENHENNLFKRQATVNVGHRRRAEVRHRRSKSYATL